MHTIRHLGTMDRLFGVPVTTRSWSTITAIVKVLGEKRRSRVPPDEVDPATFIHLDSPLAVRSEGQSSLQEPLEKVGRAQGTQPRS
jgi:hypothetical protein